MKFEKLILENFASYYGKHPIEFHTAPEKPVTIIVGGNGKGKTSIFDALNWSLYGHQYEPVLEKDNEKKITDFVNETALREATFADRSVEMVCTLFFEHEGKHYRIQQAICVKQKEETINITDRTSILHEIISTGNYSELNYIESFLNEILPSNIRDYFLFNGDRINKLALPGSSEEIRDGIYRVVDLELFQSGIKHLQEVATKYRRQAKDSSVGEMAEIENKYSLAYEELDSYKSKFNNKFEEKILLDDNIEKIAAKLRGMDEIKKLQNERDVLNEKLKSKENALRQVIVDLRSYAGTASMGFILDDIDQLRDVLNEKRSKGEIPSMISESLLKDILEIGKCICGTEFEENDRVFQQLTSRLKYEKEKDKKGHDLLDLFFSLGTARSEIEKARENIIDGETKRARIEKEIIEYNRRSAELIVLLRNAPEEEISKMAANLQEFNSDLTNLIIEIKNYENRILMKEEEIKNLRKQRDELGAKQEQVRKFQLRDNLAQQAADELMKIFDKFSEDSRLEVQEFTREEFQKFIPTGKALTIGIDKEFHYDVRDQNGNPALQQLANGQKQALSLAYITSISRVSEKKPPLVIDMPFGRLDKDVQDNIAIRLPELASQVILLVLPGSEWNEHTESILRNRTSDIYHLEFDVDNRQTTIRKE